MKTPAPALAWKHTGWDLEQGTKALPSVGLKTLFCTLMWGDELAPHSPSCCILRSRAASSPTSGPGGAQNDLTEWPQTEDWEGVRPGRGVHVGVWVTASERQGCIQGEAH